MTMQNITFTVAAMTIFATLLWVAKMALKPKKQKIAVKSKYHNR